MKKALSAVARLFPHKQFFLFVFCSMKLYIAVHCGALNPLDPQLEIHQTDNKMTSVANFSCPIGYTLVGDTSVVCVPSGQYTTAVWNHFCTSLSWKQLILYWAQFLLKCTLVDLLRLVNLVSVFQKTVIGNPSFDQVAIVRSYLQGFILHIYYCVIDFLFGSAVPIQFVHLQAQHIGIFACS